MLDTRHTRATNDSTSARRKRRSAVAAQAGASHGGGAVLLDEEGSGVLVESAPLEPRLSRSDLRARRERMEKRRRRRAIQRQLTFGLMGRETDPHAATMAIPRLEESLTGSISLSSEVVEADVTVADSTPPGGISRRDLRGKRPKQGRRSSRNRRGPIGRAVSNKRAWLGMIALVLVVVIPSSQLIDRDQDTVEDAALTSDSDSMPAITSDRSAAPTSEELKSNQERLGKATATKKKSSSSSSTSKKSASSSSSSTTTSDSPSTTTSTSGGTDIGLSTLSDAASGLGWASGLYMPGSDASNAAAFGKWRGAGVDVIVDWPARSSWDDLINPDWLYDAWADTSYTKVFGFPPFPEDGSTLSACAAGDYNSKWKQIAANIKSAGLADSTIIRLGWEFNGDWYDWAATDASSFAECWRQVVTTAEAVAPGLTWDWNVNRGVSAGQTDPTDAYPGDDYVDIVGIDSYDMWPGATSAANWDEQLNGTQGLNYWVKFAEKHGKKVSVPEWGVYPGTAQEGHNGGDNPYYIAKMKAFFESLGDTLAYEAYFNEDASYYAGSIFGTVQNPDSAAKYKEVYSK